MESINADSTITSNSAGQCLNQRKNITIEGSSIAEKFQKLYDGSLETVSYTHLRAHETKATL